VTTSKPYRNQPAIFCKLCKFTFRFCGELRRCLKLKRSNLTTEPAMQTPTTAQLRTAIEVLNKLVERLNEHAAHSVIQLPETQLGDRYAARIESRAIEQIGGIETVAAQLKSWREEILQQQKQNVSHHV